VVAACRQLQADVIVLAYRLFSPVQLVRLTRRRAASAAPTVGWSDLGGLGRRC